MYGTLRGALAGRKIAFDRDGFTVTLEGRIVGVGKPSASSPFTCTTSWRSRRTVARPPRTRSRCIRRVARPTRAWGHHRRHLGCAGPAGRGDRRPAGRRRGGRVAGGRRRPARGDGRELVTEVLA